MDLVRFLFLCRRIFHGPKLPFFHIFKGKSAPRIQYKSRDLGLSQGEFKRDALKGTNGAKFTVFFADFRRFLLIFAFPGRRRFSQKTSGNN